jgi:hypothetical protein
MIHLCLLLALAQHAPAAKTPAAVASDADLRQRIDSYLGTIERPATEAQWQALGPAAEPILREIVAGSELPTRKAKAVAGLAALGSATTPALLSKWSLDEAQPLPVRMAAVHGLARMTPDASLRTALEPVLKVRDARVGAAAAQLLATRTPAACAAVRARGANDAHFSRAIAACAQ